MNSIKKLQCILLIDDDEVTNFLNRKVIEHSHITEHIEVRLNGQEALNYLTDKDTNDKDLLPGLILLDINMPVMDGWEFIQEYAKEIMDQKKNMNIVMLSTSANPDDIKRATSLPFVKAFKSKPLTSQMLEEILTNYF